MLKHFGANSLCLFIMLYTVNKLNLEAMISVTLNLINIVNRIITVFFLSRCRDNCFADIIIVVGIVKYVFCYITIIVLHIIETDTAVKTKVVICS